MQTKQRPAAELREFLRRGCSQGKAPDLIKTIRTTPHWFKKGGDYRSIPLLYFSYDDKLFDLNKALKIIRKELGGNGLSINSSYDGKDVFAVHVSKRSEEDFRYEHYTQIEHKHMTVTLDEDGKRILASIMPECLNEGLM